MDLNDGLVADDVSATGVPALSVDYRLAPEARGATPVQDVLPGVRWVVDHAEDLGVDPARIAVMGESSAGGLAAAAAVLARDAGIRLARQILSYPMLDDRTTTTDPQLRGLVTWDWDMNWTGWHALLDDTPDVDSAVPARVRDLTGLAPAYLDVGDIDILRDETVHYAVRLARAGVATELYVQPGAIHGFDRFVPISAVSRQSTNVVWWLHRLGRSLPHLGDTVTALQVRGVGFLSVSEAIDTTTAGGRLVFHLFGALANSSGS